MKRNLVCPLNWGLGMPRAEPIIRKLVKGNEVVIAADGYPLKFLQKHTQLRTIENKSYPINIRKETHWYGYSCRSFRRYQRNRKEHRWLKKLLKRALRPSNFR